MGVFRNKTSKTLQIKTNGVNPRGIKVVEPGKTLILDDEQDYLIQTQGGGSANWEAVKIDGDEPEEAADKPAKGNKAK